MNTSVGIHRAGSLGTTNHGIFIIDSDTYQVIDRVI